MVEHTKINCETFFFKVQKVHIWVKVIYTQNLPVNCQSIDRTNVISNSMGNVKHCKKSV